MADTDHLSHDDDGQGFEAYAEGHPPTGLRYRGRPRRRGRVRRACLAASAFVVSIVFLGLIGGGLFFLRLSQGPIALDIAPQIKAALNERVGHGYAFNLGATAVEATDHGPALTITGLSVVDRSNRPVVSAPHAAIALDPLELMTGKISPRQLEIHDVDLRLLILADGEVAVSAGSAAVPLAHAFEGQMTATPAGDGVTPTDPAATAAANAEVHESPASPTNGALRALTATLRSLVDATTSPDAALGTLDDVNVTGRLVLDDRTHGTTTVFNHTELSFAKEKDGSAKLQVSADGPTGRWTITANASRGDDGTKTLALELANLSLDEITLAGGLRNLGFDFDMPLSARVGVRIAADGAIDQAVGRFELGAGYFKLDDPDHEPLLVDSMTGGFHFDPKARAIAIDATELKAGESDFVMTGRADLPRAAGDPWVIRTQATGVFGTERPGEKPVKITHAGMNFRLLSAEHKLLIDRVDVEGPEVAFESSGDLRIEGASVKLNETSSVRHMPANVLVRLWPSFIAAPVRAWLLANLRGGTVENGKAVVSLDEKDLALMRLQRSVADDHVHVDYAVSGIGLNVLNGLPPITSIDGEGTVTGNTSTFVVSHGEMETPAGHRLTLADGTFRAPDTDPKPTPAFVDAHVTGSMDAVADALGQDAIKPYASMPLDTSTVRGQVDAHLGIALKLGETKPAVATRGGVNPDVVVTANATVNNFAADKLIGKAGLTDGTLQLVADRSGVRAKGVGQIYGGPATFELRKPPGNAPGEAVLNLLLDNAARAKAGLTLKQLNGVVAAHIVAALVDGDRRSATVDLDLTKASIEGLVPGFVKPAGKPAKATLTVQPRESGGTSLDNLVFEGGGASLRGSAELDSNGDFTTARLSQVRLSPGDDLKLDASQSGGTLKLVARGANVDARPFLKWLSAPAKEDIPAKGDAAQDIDVELHAGVLTGQNSQAISNADLRMFRHGGQIRNFQLTGRIGGAPVSVGTVKQDGAPLFVIRSSDAGSSLAFMDLYKRMAGGRLDANLAFGRGQVDGFATVRDFTLKEDPAIKKLATESLANQSRTADADKLDPSSVPFTKLEVKFTKSGSKVAVEDGSLFGPTIGATVKGNLDLGRDQVNLHGTFVPLYGLNNLFSQVPLFGPLLGGGKHEGLFGINYRITGSPSKPVMTINPLSAVAPGFLREIFGAFDNAAQNLSDPRDTAPGPGQSRPQVPSQPADQSQPADPSFPLPLDLPGQ